MDFKTTHLQQLYQGYLNTPLLWESNSLQDLQQFQIKLQDLTTFKRTIHKPLRLGLLAEQFVFNQLEQTDHFKILAENIQIQKEKHTLGELDALIKCNEEFIHLEIVYKFYLYDPSLGNDEIERWIGPNRNDSCIEKITKLKHKQLPLLYTSACEATLKNLKLPQDKFKQQVLFKAQLFVPYNHSAVFETLNKNCVKGFYLNKKHLTDFKQLEFYIPPKLDWLLEPHNHVEWLSHSSLLDKAESYLVQKRSTLIWIKTSKTFIHKCFLVWW